jgi:hypothetical protein
VLGHDDLLATEICKERRGNSGKHKWKSKRK